MRMQHEHAAPHQVAGAAFDAADARVTVLHGRRELACLEGGAHPRPFAPGDAPAEDERLSAAADPAVLGAHQHFVLGRRPQPFGPNLAAARSDHPERLRLLVHAWTF
jgi:hypothetical protein